MRGRRVLGTLALVVCSLAFALGLSELALRLAGYQAIYEVYSKPEIFWTYDELLGWSHEPDAEGVYVGPRPWPVEFETPVRINSLGLRGPELGRRGEDELRVLVLGDSMVAGFEVPYADTFVARLEPLLSERLGRRVKVINGGVRGYGTDQSLLFYRERGRALEPDAVVLFFSQNDLINNTTLHLMRRAFGKPAFALGEDDGLRLVGAPVPRYPVCSDVRLGPDFEQVRTDGLAARAVCRAQITLFDRSALFSFLTLLVPWDSFPGLLRSLYYLGFPRSPSLKGVQAAPESAYLYRLSHRLVRELAQETRRDRVPFVLTGLPREIQRLEQNSEPFADLSIVRLEAIEAAEPLEIRFHHDSHFRARGHEIVAESLLPAIEKALLDDRLAAGRD